MFRGLLDREYTLYRPAQAVDAYGTPAPAELEVISRGRCAVSRKKFATSQGEPMLEQSRGLRVYAQVGIGARAGDIVEISGIGKLRLAQAYEIYGHHTEIDAEWEDDA